MQMEDQYLDRTPDLVAKVRAMREAADREMDRFTCVDDYDVRRVIGQGPKAATLSHETASLSRASEHPKKATAKSTTAQTSIDFAPAPEERGEAGESA